MAASVTAKIVDVACNLAALAWFGYSGHVFWWVGAMHGYMQYHWRDCGQPSRLAPWKRISEKGVFVGDRMFSRKNRLRCVWLRVLGFT
jgi:hypothetical protein